MRITNDSTEQAIAILAGLIDRAMPGAATDTILDAIYYLRSGHYPFNRARRQEDGF